MELRNISSGSDLASKLASEGMPGLIILLGDEQYLQDSMTAAVERCFSAAGDGSVVRISGGDSELLLKLENELLTFDMFADRKMVILREADANVLKAVSTRVGDLTAALGPDRLLLTVGPHIRKETLKAQWFRKFSDAIPNITVQFYAPDPARLPRWLTQEADALGLQLNTDAAALLAESFEGNLGGAVQTLKTIMIQGKSRIGAQDVAPFLGLSTRFMAFDISDALLAGDSYRALKIARSLADQQGDNTPMLLAELGKMLNLILRLRQAQEVPANLFRNCGVFLPAKQNQFQNIARRMPPTHLNNLIRLFALINQSRTTFDEGQTARYVEAFLAFFSSPRELEGFLQAAPNV